MQKYCLYILTIMLIVSCKKLDLSKPIVSCSGSLQSFNYSKAQKLQEILVKYTKQGIPGVSMAVKTTTQEWAGASGFAKIEDQTSMEICNLQYAQSIVKSYTAVLVMMLYEDGKINLDNPIKNYLPTSISNHITNSDKITVKMLLNHTSGIFDYAYDYSYSANLLSNQDEIFTYLKLLSYAYDKKSEFEPGSKYSYCNTNYLLLALMVNEITGKDHSVMMTNCIFKPLKLTHTFYKNESGYLNYPELVNSYLNRRSDNKIENVTMTQVNNVISMIGDDGIVATPMDYVYFLDGLVHGKLLRNETLDLMRNWVNDKNGKPVYGLGLAYRTQNNNWGYGHGGSGIGAGAILFYFPEKDVTIFVGVNIGTLIEGHYKVLYDNMKDELLNIVLE
ncbi:MAG: serine hydrolase domain-containing protein [Mariniphaga sp.]